METSKLIGPGGDRLTRAEQQNGILNWALAQSRLEVGEAQAAGRVFARAFDEVSERVGRLEASDIKLAQALVEAKAALAQLLGEALAAGFGSNVAGYNWPKAIADAQAVLEG